MRTMFLRTYLTPSYDLYYLRLVKSMHHRVFAQVCVERANRERLLERGLRRNHPFGARVREHAEVLARFQPQSAQTAPKIVRCAVQILISDPPRRVILKINF